MHLCGCGCGGTPKTGRCLPGHNKRRIEYVEEDRGHGTPCWVWVGHRKDGYGYIVFEGEGKVAHRFMYERERGRVPDGLELDHLCRVRACVNPAHLEPVTRAENVRRGRSAKLSAADAFALRLVKATTTLTLNEVGEMFDINRATVSRIWAGRYWSTEVS